MDAGSGRCRGATRGLAWLTGLGGLAVLGPLAFAVVIWLARHARCSDAIWLLATIASGRIVVEGLKLAVQRPRPAIIDSLEIVTSFSFPSSHSAGSMLSLLALALVLTRRRRAIALASRATRILTLPRRLVVDYDNHYR